jgi:hypothetical protein
MPNPHDPHEGYGGDKMQNTMGKTGGLECVVYSFSCCYGREMGRHACVDTRVDAVNAMLHLSLIAKFVRVQYRKFTTGTLHNGKQTWQLLGRQNRSEFEVARIRVLTCESRCGEQTGYDVLQGHYRYCEGHAAPTHKLQRW